MVSRLGWRRVDGSLKDRSGALRCRPSDATEPPRTDASQVLLRIRYDRGDTNQRAWTMDDGTFKWDDKLSTFTAYVFDGPYGPIVEYCESRISRSRIPFGHTVAWWGTFVHDDQVMAFTQFSKARYSALTGRIMNDGSESTTDAIIDLLLEAADHLIIHRDMRMTGRSIASVRKFDEGPRSTRHL